LQLNLVAEVNYRSQPIADLENQHDSEEEESVSHSDESFDEEQSEEEES